jgi:hypothetical protein
MSVYSLCDSAFVPTKPFLLTLPTVLFPLHSCYSTLPTPPQVKPIAMAPIGRYAMSVDWSDGHKALYPFRQIAKLAAAQTQAQTESVAAVVGEAAMAVDAPAS